jgi:hypothetical protein
MVPKTGANMVPELFLVWYLAVLGIWIRMFLGLPDLDPLVRDMDPDHKCVERIEIMPAK